jgi:ankyrin repeat protein
MSELDLAPLFMAVGKNDITTVSALVNPGNINGKINGNGLLHIAATKGNIEIAELLIARGADVNATTNTNKTPLFFASREGHTRMVAFLLSHGADPLITTAEGFTPLGVAGEKGHEQIVELLTTKKTTSKDKSSEKQFDKDKYPIHYAVQNGIFDSTDLPTRLYPSVSNPKNTVSSLITSENVDDPATKGRFTPLHVAAMNGKKRRSTLIGEFLINKGANIDAKTNSGFTPLHIVASKNDAMFASMLIRRGASIDRQDNQHNRTPLHIGLENHHFKVAAFLISKGANINSTVFGETPLFTAAKTGDDILVKFLIDHHASTSIRDGTGYTPLHIAAEKGHYTIVKMLYPITEERNTSVMVKQQPRPRGPFVLTEIPDSTPHDLAAKKGHSKTAGFLKRGWKTESLVYYLGSRREEGGLGLPSALDPGSFTDLRQYHGTSEGGTTRRRRQKNRRNSSKNYAK